MEEQGMEGLVNLKSNKVICDLGLKWHQTI